MMCSFCVGMIIKVVERFFWMKFVDVNFIIISVMVVFEEKDNLCEIIVII